MFKRLEAAEMLAKEKNDQGLCLLRIGKTHYTKTRAWMLANQPETVGHWQSQHGSGPTWRGKPSRQMKLFLEYVKGIHQLKNFVCKSCISN